MSDVMRNPQSQYTEMPPRNDSESQTKMIDTSGSMHNPQSRKPSEQSSAYKSRQQSSNDNRNQSSNHSKSMANQPGEFEDIWGLQQNMPNEDIVEEQSQESEDEAVTAAYGAPKERADSFSDEEDPNRHRDDRELDNFFNFADGAQQNRATNSEYIKKNGEKANDKDLKLQLVQQSSSGQQK